MVSRGIEERLVQAVNDSGALFAIPYGPSSTAPEDDVRAFELYFERLDAAGLDSMKRPDLLIARITDREFIMDRVGGLGGTSELPFVQESH